MPNNRIFEYSINGSNIQLVFSGSNIRIKNAASTTTILNWYFLIVIFPHHPHYHVAQLPIGVFRISNIRSKSKSKYLVTILFENAQPYVKKQIDGLTNTESLLMIPSYVP